MTARRGQVALYLVFVLVAITILTLMNAGAFLAVRAKNHAMNAGDAAALAAARRQAELLNEIGRLNLRHFDEDMRQLAKHKDERDWKASLAIVARQRRLCFLGPLECVRDANKAAKANNATPSPEMSEILSSHASDVGSLFAANPDLYPEPWDGAWEKYANELSALAAEGIAAGCDNIDFLDAIECFPLTSKSFYSMVEGESWCKIVVARWNWLLSSDLRNLPLPSYTPAAAVVNSEVCPLHLKVSPLPWSSQDELAYLCGLASANGLSPTPPLETEDGEPIEDDRDMDDPSRLYFFYDESHWCDWSPQISKANLPLVGTVKPEFDVRGCSCIFRVYEEIPQLLSESSRLGSWNAAAKPFGTIETFSGRSKVTDEAAKGMVLPAFEAVRLVPIALADNGNDLSTADKPWLDHVRKHVPAFLERGADALSPSCRYCQCLLKWSDPEFRSKAASWVEANAETCRRGSGSYAPSGGTSYAH